MAVPRRHCLTKEKRRNAPNLSPIAQVYAAALENFPLKVSHGEIVPGSGGSGCANSTHLRLVSGLDAATRGRVMLEGQRILAPHPSIGLIFQEPRLLPWPTVVDNVGFCLAGAIAGDSRQLVFETSTARSKERSPPGCSDCVAKL